MFPLLTSPSAVSFRLSLTLLVFRRLANHPHYSLAVDDLALVTNFLYRCSYFHKSVLSSQLPVLSNCNCSCRPLASRGIIIICSGTQSDRDSDRKEKVRPRLCRPAICV